MQINFKSILENISRAKPLIHCITNVVTANDCANVLLACGSSPIMADAVEEAADVTANSNGLCINIGTLNEQTIPSMFAGGRKANALSHPVILDPVGVGVSALRRQTVKQLMKEIRFTAIRGNLSEIRTLAEGKNSGRGADTAELSGEEDQDGIIRMAKSFSEQIGAIVVISGKVDIVADKNRAICIDNGHPMMQKVTGTGCMLSVVTAAFIAACPENVFEAAAAAVCTMGLAGEIAHKRLKAGEGNMTYRKNLIDAIYTMTAEQLEQGARYAMR